MQKFSDSTYGKLHYRLLVQGVLLQAGIWYKPDLGSNYLSNSRYGPEMDVANTYAYWH